MSGFIDEDDLFERHLEEVYLPQTMRGPVSTPHVLQDVRWVGDYLNQSESWIPSDRSVVKIKDMSAVHALRACQYLASHAAEVVVALDIADARHGEGVERIIASADPLSIVTAMPLYMALARRAATAPSDSPPWR